MSEERGRRIVQSLLYAAEQLEGASSGPDVRAAVRDCALALEHHLDTLAKDLNADPSSIHAIEPALIPRARNVEAGLKQLLLTCWEFLARNDTELGDFARARDFARQMRDAGHEDIDLVFASLLLPQGLD
ncbi:MAG: hypothetical protein M9925_03625 [Chloroflexi bacterium]|nr:hypothetical protein [Dehalococcoidia bacterium]MCO5200771.1 hypothetical protein [Chloroflexota bacterium]MCZ7578630.1 hypothetical protein [Dehalococcoidia bacterium]NJD65926.1 hypothetical protein [Chloroflexota bacterium]PWB44970.1 MAG: hypothetical protein C3F10_07105 [Dehalococcoidia bacterium]